MSLLPQCDLVGLATLADTEDALARLTSARFVRCRHGNVPLEALLDVHVEPTAAPLAAGGLVSHEVAPSGEARLRLGDGGSRSVKRRLEEDGAADGQGDALHGSHALELQRVHNVVWRASSGPVCGASFSAWLLHAARAPGLLRAKGQLYVRQRRRSRFAFHVSGARRVEVVEEEPWEGPGATLVVLIGTSRGELLALRDELEALSAAADAADDAFAARAAEALAALLAADARFEVATTSAASTATSDRPGCVTFGLRGKPHLGVTAAAVNAALARRFNAAPEQRFLLWSGGAHACLHIMLASRADVDPAHASVLLHADAAQREALMHVGVCNCG